MATKFHVLTNAQERLDIPAVRTLTFADLTQSLREGWDDFWEKPSHLVFLGLIYPLVGVIIGLWSSGVNSWPLIFPLVSGFALVGPFVALPIYEMSRREEMGLDTHWLSALEVFRSPAFASIAAIGVMMLVLFTLWLMVAQFLYEQLFGPGSPPNFMSFLDEVLHSPQGMTLMIWGNLIGFLFAAVALISSVISIPLLLDRDVGAAVAVGTSIRVFLKNPVMIAVWGLMVAALLVIGAIPLLVGLAVVVPVLGHATWHLYRHAVVPPGEALTSR